MKWLLRSFLGCLLGISLPASAFAWTLDASKSQVRFVIKQMNVPVEGGFKRFDVRADFKASRPEAGQFRVDLDVSGIDTGSPDGDAEALRPVWFDAKRYPRATFISKKVKKLADSRFMASGDLVVKGLVRPLDVVFTLVPQPAGAWLAEGRFALKRADFGIGGGDWNDVVDDAAEARFRFWLLP